MRVNKKNQNENDSLECQEQNDVGNNEREDNPCLKIEVQEEVAPKQPNNRRTSDLQKLRKSSSVDFDTRSGVLVENTQEFPNPPPRSSNIRSKINSLIINMSRDDSSSLSDAQMRIFPETYPTLKNKLEKK